MMVDFAYSGSLLMQISELGYVTKVYGHGRFWHYVVLVRSSERIGGTVTTARKSRTDWKVLERGWCNTQKEASRMAELAGKGWAWRVKAQAAKDVRVDIDLDP